MFHARRQGQHMLWRPLCNYHKIHVKTSWSRYCLFVSIVVPKQHIVVTLWAHLLYLMSNVFIEAQKHRHNNQFKRQSQQFMLQAVVIVSSLALASPLPMSLSKDSKWNLELIICGLRALLAKPLLICRFQHNASTPI